MRLQRCAVHHWGLTPLLHTVGRDADRADHHGRGSWGRCSTPPEPRAGAPSTPSSCGSGPTRRGCASSRSRPPSGWPWSTRSRGRRSSRWPSSWPIRPSRRSCTRRRATWPRSSCTTTCGRNGSTTPSSQPGSRATAARCRSSGCSRQSVRVRLRHDEGFTDWQRRPLTPTQIEYAADDVRYLLAAADALAKRLGSQGRRGVGRRGARGPLRPRRAVGAGPRDGLAPRRRSREGAVRGPGRPPRGGARGASARPAAATCRPRGS